MDLESHGFLTCRLILLSSTKSSIGFCFSGSGFFAGTNTSLALEAMGGKYPDGVWSTRCVIQYSGYSGEPRNRLCGEARDAYGGSEGGIRCMCGVLPIQDKRVLANL